jgi:hypothetical protein
VSRNQSNKERWYEFEQRETFTRRLFVKASSLTEARRKRYSDEAVSDYAPLFPDLHITARARLVADDRVSDIETLSVERESGSR